jgi:hypothetical protein
VDELLGLSGNGSYDGGVTVAELANGDSRQHIEIFVSAIVPKAASGALHKQGWEPAVGSHQVVVVGLFYGVVLEHVSC